MCCRPGQKRPTAGKMVGKMDIKWKKKITLCKYWIIGMSESKFGNCNCFLKFIISVRDGHCYCSPRLSKTYLGHWRLKVLRIFRVLRWSGLWLVCQRSELSIIMIHWCSSIVRTTCIAVSSRVPDVFCSSIQPAHRCLKHRPAVSYPVCSVGVYSQSHNRPSALV